MLNCTYLSKTLADGLEDSVVLDVVGVVGLELGGNTSERALQSLLGRGIDHLGLLRSVSDLLISCAFHVEKHTWTPASSGDQAMKVILLLEKS